MRRVKDWLQFNSRIWRRDAIEDVAGFTGCIVQRQPAQKKHANQALCLHLTRRSSATAGESEFANELSIAVIGS